MDIRNQLRMLIILWSCWFAPLWASRTPFADVLGKAESMLLTDPRLSLQQMEKFRNLVLAEGSAEDRLRLRVIAARSLGLLGRSADLLRWAEPGLKDVSEEIKPRTRVQLLCVLAEGYEFAGQVAKARVHFQEALRVADASGDPWVKAYARNALAWMENRLAHSKEVVELLMEAFRLMQDQPKDDLHADLLNNLGMQYSDPDMKRRKESERLLLESLEYFESRKKTFYAATLQYNLGLFYRATDPQKSIGVLQKALKSSQLIQDTAGIAYAHSALGQTYYAVNQFTRSLEESTKALAGFEATGNSMMIADTWQHHLLALIANKQTKEAYDILPIAEKLIRADGSTKNKIQMLESKIDILRAMHKTDEELATWSELYKRYQDFVNQQDTEAFNRFSTDLDLARRDHENQLQALELKQNRQDSELKTRVILVTLLFMLLLVVGLGVVIRQMRRIRLLQIYVETNVLRRFLPPEIVKEVRAGRSQLDEEATIKRITVIFADLVDFTSSSERLGATKGARVLNDFLMGMTEVILSEGGTIDKFIGDAVMVIFGAPTGMASTLQAEKALSCARLMQKKLAELNETWEKDFDIRFSMRIGISQGEAMVGTFGSSKRSDYTAIGTTVNLAARIEAHAMPDQILVSDSVADLIPASQRDSRGFFKLKGIQDEQELFEVVEDTYQKSA